MGGSITWTFAFKTHQVEKSSEFKSSKYGGQFTRAQKSSNNYWVVLGVWTGIKLAERRIFHQDSSFLWFCPVQSSQQGLGGKRTPW
jgi:hypothetical protein